MIVLTVEIVMKIHSFNYVESFDEIVCFTSYRSDGNMALHVYDNPKKVIKNREKIAEILGIDMEQMIFMDQVHENRVAVIQKSDFGRGVYSANDAIFKTDAMVTNMPECTLLVQVADCVPLLFFDSAKRVIGTAHAGWKGTVQRIAQKTVQTMQKQFQCNLEDIRVGMGPSIGPCCYSIGDDVAEVVKKNEIAGFDQEKKTLNLWKANKDQLLEVGVLKKNIDIIQECTSCSQNTYFSYRKEKEKAGRFVLGIMLKKDEKRNSIE